MRIVIISIILVLSLAACNTGIASPTATQEALGMTLVPENTATATETISSSPSPASRIKNCPGAPPIRLIIQERGRVLNDDNRTLNLRDGPGVNAKIITRIEPEQLFFVLSGPECDGAYAWFRVQYGSRTGWIAEGDNDSYYVEPYLPG